MFNRIANKILISYTAIVLVLVAILFIFVDGMIYRENIALLKREMDEKADFIALVLSERAVRGTENAATLASESERIARIVGLRVTLVDFTGRVVADSEVKDLSSIDNHLHRTEIEGAALSGYGDSLRHSSTLNLDTLYYAKKTEAYYVRLAKPLEKIQDSLRETRRRLLIFLAAAAAAGFLSVFFVARRMTKPIRETYLFAREFAEGKYERRIRNYSDDEVGSVQRALNKLADTVVEKMNGLVAEQSKLVTAFETLSDGIAVIRADRTVEFVNSAFRDLFSPALSAEGRRSYEVIRSRRINAKIEEALTAAKPLRFDEESGDGLVLEIYLSPVMKGDLPVSLLLVAHDVSEHKRIERIKSDLVGNMSHELKTPVTIMKGYLETLRDNTGDPAMGKTLIARAIENADRQNALINDILKLHMIESSSEMIRERVNIADVVGSCVSILSSKAALRNISLQTVIGVDAVIENSNRFLAEEVLFNIIDNAISYNMDGGSVTVSLESQDGRTVCAIRDTGVGIPPESIGRIFERFYRVDKSRSRATGGTGLGLSIVRHAADFLGWRITVQSGETGSEFRVMM
jgi:two-component system phosphate regulon sensor histidine kinase PhoR